MQPQCLYACCNLTSPRLFPHSYHPRLDLIPLIGGISIADGKCRGGHLKAKRKENIWSVDNDLAEKAALREKKRRDGGKRRGKRNLSGRKEKMDSRILVSGPLLVELETVLQTQVLQFFLSILVSVLEFHQLGTCCCKICCSQMQY